MALFGWLSRFYKVGGNGKTGRYALFAQGTDRPLTLDPATDRFSESSLTDLQVWDVQDYDDAAIWFMGNSPRPRKDFYIRELTPEELKKIR